MALWEVGKLELGFVENGWVGGPATTVGLGSITPARQKLLERTQASLHEGIQKARSGARLGGISHAVESTVTAAGDGLLKEFVGHGLGRKLHEEPQIPNFGRANSGPILRPGMTLAIAPMVNEGMDEVRILQDEWNPVTSDRLDQANFVPANLNL